jgi:hypothetical protein
MRSPSIRTDNDVCVGQGLDYNETLSMGRKTLFVPQVIIPGVSLLGDPAGPGPTENYNSSAVTFHSEERIGCQLHFGCFFQRYPRHDASTDQERARPPRQSRPTPPPSHLRLSEAIHERNIISAIHREQIQFS